MMLDIDKHINNSIQYQPAICSNFYTSHRDVREEDTDLSPVVKELHANRERCPHLQDGTL